MYQIAWIALGSMQIESDGLGGCYLLLSLNQQNVCPRLVLHNYRTTLL